MKAEEVINNTEEEKELAQSQIRQVANWFHENPGELIPKQEAISELKNDLDVDIPQHLTEEEFYSQLIGDLVGDHVDPVQMVNNGKGKYVGVIDYSEHDTYYTYDEYHDIEGKYTRGVCAACIHESSKSSEPFTRHTGKFGNEPYGDEEQLKEEIEIHVDAVHSGDSVEVETGATLASGTTIAGNTSVHLGNESFLDESGDTATGTVTFEGSPSISASNNVQVGTDQSIEDGSGTDRISLNNGGTAIFNDNGDVGISTRSDSFGTTITAYDGSPVNIRDGQGAFDAVTYSTDASTGTLELTNTELIASNGMNAGNSNITNVNAINHSDSRGIMEIRAGSSTTSFDFRDSTDSDVFSISTGGTVTVPTGNLRLSTGQAIEDGSGTSRLDLDSAGTFLRNQSNDVDIAVQDGIGTFIRARSGQPLLFEDKNGDFTAFRYDTSSTAPGTLELTNSDLIIPNGHTQRISDTQGSTGLVMENTDGSFTTQIQFKNIVSGTTTSGKIRGNNGEIEVVDDAGNVTTIS